MDLKSQLWVRRRFVQSLKSTSKFVETPEEYVGKSFEFIITKYSGRDIVVSRREFKGKRERIFIKLEANWAENLIVHATVSEVKDFGLILSIDNVSGLCHISEVAHQRVGHPGEKYSV